MQRASDVAKATAAYPAVLATFEDELQELRASRVATEARLRQMLSAMTSFRDGDFSVRLPTDWAGTDGRIAEAFNQALAHEERISREVARLSATVGKEGRLKQRMSLPGALGGWASKVDSLNTLIDDLVRPTTEVARTIGAVAKGDLGQSMELEVDGRALKGEFLRSAKLVNTMIEQLSVFTSEVTRVAREVGTEGKLGGQAQVKGVSGVWKELTDSVNQMAGNLTAQVRNIADVTIAVANGDLSKKITVDVRGEILQLKEAINTMVDQLRSFASEVTRVAREVGTDGRLGGQAVVPGVAGTWKDLTDSVNAMATNLTAQVRNIADGDHGRGARRPVAQDHGRREGRDPGAEGNHQHDGRPAQRLLLGSDARGARGRHRGQARRPGAGARRRRHLEGPDRLGQLDGLEPDRPGAQHRRRDHRRRQGRPVAQDHGRGEGRDPGAEEHHQHDGRPAQRLRLGSDARGARGRHRGQARRPGRRCRGVAGTWKDLTDNVNFMASNLTGQVRNIAEVTTAVANGDLSKKITVDVKGEILELKNTINTMVDQLNGFASEVTRVAREVGTEGKLGGQAEVRGVAGTWKDLTDSVNSMATNLTGQVRNIADVTTAVANGDLSQEDHRRRARRDSRAEEHDQHDGRPAQRASPAR